MTCTDCSGQGCLLCSPGETLKSLEPLVKSVAPAELASIQRDLQIYGQAGARITLDRTLTSVPLTDFILFLPPGAMRLTLQEYVLAARRGREYLSKAIRDKAKGIAAMPVPE